MYGLYWWYVPLKVTRTQAFIRALAEDSRRVFAAWRALLILRDITIEIHPSERRWSHFPFQEADISDFLRGLQRAGLIRQLGGSNRLFEVTAPYADLRPLHEFEVFAEAYPYSYISGSTAMFFHGMTWERSNRLFATSPISSVLRPLPVGTSQDDWNDLTFPSEIRLQRIRSQHIDVRRTKKFDLLGVVETRDVGSPIRIATRERTLVEGLYDPERFGGIGQVFRAWYSTLSSMNAQQVVEITERFETKLLRQRVGYVMSSLGFDAPQFMRWRQEANRGSSSKLDAASPFSPRFSEEWKLSLNAPVEVLHEESR